MQTASTAILGAQWGWASGVGAYWVGWVRLRDGEFDF